MIIIFLYDISIPGNIQCLLTCVPGIVPVAFFMYFLHLLFLTVLWYFVYILQMTKQPVSCSLSLSKHKVSPLFRYNLVPSLSNSDSVYLWLIHVDVWQKPSQYCKVITFQLKQIKFKKELHFIAGSCEGWSFERCFVKGLKHEPPSCKSCGACIVCEKQGTEIVNLLTAPHQGTSHPQSDGQIPMDQEWESGSAVFRPCACRKYSR